MVPEVSSAGREGLLAGNGTSNIVTALGLVSYRSPVMTRAGVWLSGRTGGPKGSAGAGRRPGWRYSPRQLPSLLAA